MAIKFMSFRGKMGTQLGKWNGLDTPINCYIFYGSLSTCSADKHFLL